MLISEGKPTKVFEIKASVRTGKDNFVSCMRLALAKEHPESAYGLGGIFEISKGRLGATVVLDALNNIKGIITDGDIRRLFEKTDDIKTLAASDIVISNPKTILNDAYAVDALEKMNSFNINQLVVVNSRHQYLGIIHLHDLIREGII